jgi:hypothetical protein
MADQTAIRINLAKWPWATIMALVVTIVLGVTSLIEPEELNFDEYTTAVVVVWSFLAVGRGAALREQTTLILAPLDRFLNTFPWATVVAGVVAVVGYIGSLTSDTLTIQELGVKLGILIGTLGIGRGLGVLKQDVLENRVNPAGYEYDIEAADGSDSEPDADMGAEDEPTRGTPLGWEPGQLPGEKRTKGV